MEFMRMDNINCPCKRTKCERYGNCDTCRAHHNDKWTIVNKVDRKNRKIK